MESTFTDFGVAIHQHWLIWLWKCNLINNLITEVGNDLEIREGIANLNSQQVANEMAIRKMEILTPQRSAFWRGVGESGAICKKSSENNSSRSNCHRWSPLHGSIWSSIDSKRPNTHFSQRGPTRPGTTDAKSLPAWASPSSCTAGHRGLIPLNFTATVDSGPIPHQPILETLGQRICPCLDGKAKMAHP